MALLQKRHGHGDRRIEPGSIAAWLFALALIAGMFWMGITGNRFCCDPRSLLGHLRTQIFTPSP